MKLNLKWSEPARISTRRGDRVLRTAEPTEDFWQAWETNKDEMKAAGFSVGKEKGRFLVKHWGEPDPEEDKQAIAESRADDSDLELPCPRGESYLPYQKAGIAYCLNRENALIADEMGLGKTIQAIGIANADESLKRILIVAPAFLKQNWKRELEKWFIRPAIITIIEGKSFKSPKRKTLDARIFIINYEVLVNYSQQLHAIEWDLIIADECHYLKTPESQRTKALFGRKAKRGNKKKGIPPAPAIPPVASRRFVALTGTPILNRPIEIWPIVHRLAPDEFPDYFSFVKRYCGGGRGYGNSLQKDGASNLEELQRKLRRSIMVRRLKKDVLKDLPPKTRQVIELPPTKELKRVLDKETREWSLHEETIAKLSARRANAEVTGNDADYRAAAREIGKKMKVALDRIADYRKEAGVMKVPMVSHYLKEALESEEQLIVFCHHHEVVDGIMAALEKMEITCAKVHGGVADGDRQRAVDDFQAGKVRVFVGTIGAAGVGLTLTNARMVIFAELDWTPGKITQAEDRAHRIGQENPVLIHHLVLENSLDSNMVKLVIDKQETIHGALDAEITVDGSLGADKPPEDIEIADKKPKTSPYIAIGEAMSISEREIAHKALKLIAAMDSDGASHRNAVGFSRLDTVLGNELAEKSSLSVGQAGLAKKLALKYRRQLPDEIIDKLQ